MKAAVLYSIGDLRVVNVTTPKPKEGEALIKIKGSGVCGSDVPRVMKKGAYKLPLIPGHELAGEIVEIGGQNISNFKVEDRVTIIPLIPCNSCSYCTIGEYAQCDNYDYIGSRRNGGFAEYISVPLTNLVKIPDNVSFTSAAMTEPASVALHAVRRVNIELGDEVTILGAGPVGIILAQWASLSGAKKIFIVDIMEEKLKIAKKLGFKYSFNATSEEPVEKIKSETDNKGADVCFEAAGTPVTFEQSLRIVRKLGKVVLLGNVEGEVMLPEETASMILRGQLEIHGSWNSSFAPLPKNEWKTTLQFMNLKKLSVEPLISHKLNLSQAKEAFDMMSKRKEFFNKVMFIS